MESQSKNEVLPDPSTGAVLNLPKDGYYKITKSGEVKLPRRLLHCSDGIYEEYSTDEDEDEEDVIPYVDPQSLTWGPYLWHYTSISASKGLAVCDYFGEKLAWFFGITTPRFQYALDELERRRLEEEEDEQQAKEEREAEMKYIQTMKEKSSSHEYDNVALEVGKDQVADNSV